MSVSTGSENDETMMAIKGGATFDERLNQMAFSKASLEKAYTDLQLGSSASEAHKRTKALEDEAKSKYDTAVQSCSEMIIKANEDALAIFNKARATAERDRKAIDDERAALYALRDSAVAEIGEKHAAVERLVNEAAANRREAADELFEAQELKNGLLRDQDAYNCELKALKKLRDKVATMIVELHYLEVSPHKVPVVDVPVLPVVLPAVEVGQSMGGVADSTGGGQSMGGVEERIE